MCSAPGSLFAFWQMIALLLAVQFVRGSSSQSPKTKKKAKKTPPKNNQDNISYDRYNLDFKKQEKEQNLHVRQSKGPSSRGKRKISKQNFRKTKPWHIFQLVKNDCYSVLHRITWAAGSHPARLFRARNASHSSLRRLGGCWILLNTTGILRKTETTVDKALFDLIRVFCFF